MLQQHRDVLVPFVPGGIGRSLAVLVLDGRVGATLHEHADNRVVDGTWWRNPDPAQPQISIASEFRVELGLKVGDRLAFDRIATAFAGQDHVTGFPGNPPTRPGLMLK